MCDFDLSQALESPLDLDKTGCESSCFNMTDIQNEIIRLDAGLELVISRNPKTMRGVATLVVAMNRLKESLTDSKWPLSNSDLCMAIMDNLVDETLVQTVADVTTGQRRLIYQRNQSRECTLSDTHKKDIVCSSDDLRLQAVTLKGGNVDHKVNFRLVPLFYTGADCGPPAQTFVLSVKSTKEQKQYLSCKMNSNNVELHLEECSDEYLMQNSDDVERFVFYKRVEGVSLSCFESFLYPGWFISTSETENQPVEMCRVDSAQRVTHFNITYEHKKLF